MSRYRCKRKDIFETKEKLFFRRVSENLIFTYDNEQYFSLNTLIVVNLREKNEFKIKYILSLMNSRLMNYIYKNKFKSTKTVFSEIQAHSVGLLPIPNINIEFQQPFIDLVDKILTCKDSNPKADTAELEKEIDTLVYVLYGLNDEEIAIVEGR